jgi:hypothetical protein
MGVASRHEDNRVTITLAYVLWLVFRVIGRRYSFCLHLPNTLFRLLTHAVIVVRCVTYCVFIVVHNQYSSVNKARSSSPPGIALRLSKSDSCLNIRSLISLPIAPINPVGGTNDDKRYPAGSCLNCAFE